MVGTGSVAKHIRFLRRAAAELHSLAAGAPEIADDLRRVASELESGANELGTAARQQRTRMALRRMMCAQLSH